MNIYPLEVNSSSRMADRPPTQLRLLLVEDSEDDALLLRRLLHRGGYTLSTFERVDTPEAMRAALADQTWDIVITDYSMPRFDGMTALAIFKESGQDIPFFVVSGIIGEDVAVAAMKAGAHDYIMKGNLNRLLPAIQRELEEHRVRHARREAEDQLRKLSLAVEQSPNAIFITNLQGEIEYINPRFTETTGYTKAETLGRTPRLLQSGLTPPATYESLRQQLEAGHEWRGELLNRRKSGETYWSSITIAPIKNAAGVTTHYVAIEEDITERKLAEEALRDSEARFRQLVEHAADALFVVDPRGRVVNVNQQTCTSLGYTREELMGMAIADIDVEFRPQPDFETWFERNLDQTGTISGRHQRKDGTTFPVEVRMGYFDMGGRKYILALARDMTERELMQAELERYAGQLANLVDERTRQLSRTMEQLQAILNNSSDAIALARPNGDIIAANPAFERLFDFRVQTAIEQILDVIPEPQHLEKASHALFDVLEHGRGARVEVSLVRSDSRSIDVDIALTPVKTQTGALDGIVLSLRDITHLKEIDRFKTRFVANAAHDLANPIANLKLQIYALRASPARLEYHLTALEAQTRRLENLVNDLRMLSQLDRGAVQFHMESLDLGALIEEVVVTHAAQAESKQQTVHLNVADHLPLILGDRSKLERVIANLFANAVNYTPIGGAIDVDVDRDEDQVRLTVSDTGIGIEAADQPRIFERFYRSDGAKLSGVEGTGLGLSIVKEIVDTHNGRVTVESTPGQGSTFSVYLPCAQAR